MAAATEARGGRRLGLRREILILLPAALLLLAILSTFTLFSYRASLSLLAEERQDEAARLARSLADRVAASGGRLPSASELREMTPGARGVALVGLTGGAPLVTAGDLPTADLLAPAGAGRAIPRPLGVGPDERSPNTVVGLAPVLLAGRPGAVRVDLPAEILAGQLRSLRVLSMLVLSVNSALVLLVLLFLRHLLRPYEMLLARARAVGDLGDLGDRRQGGGETGEIELLLSTFERALEALSGRESRRADDDIAALERTLSPSLQSGLLLLDRQGRVLALNAMGAALLGTAAPEPGAPLAGVLAGQPEMLEVLAAAVAEGTAPQRQECTVHSGERTLTVGLTVHPLRRGASGADETGDVRGYLVLFADLTDVLRQAEETRRADSLARLGEMAGGVAHELRNSLATLRGYLTLIERRPDESTVADFLSEIRHEADHLERVLQDFLSFARPGTARFQEVSLAHLLRRAAADPALGGFAVRVEVPAADVLLRGDPQLLERALRNVLHNAVQAEGESGRTGPVELSLSLVPDAAHTANTANTAEAAEAADAACSTGMAVEVAVEDCGPGLPPEIRERLFHPFATGRPHGVGLGLALAHRIVVLHGGRIRLDDRPGGGTRAVFWFPGDTLVTEGNKEGEDPSFEEPPSRAS